MRIAVFTDQHARAAGGCEQREHRRAQTPADICLEAMASLRSRCENFRGRGRVARGALSRCTAGVLSRCTAEENVALHGGVGVSRACT